MCLTNPMPVGDPAQYMTLHEWLRSFDACHEAREWARQYNLDPNRAWHECPRADWMHWLLMVQFGASPVTQCDAQLHYALHFAMRCRFCGEMDWTPDDIRAHVPDFPF